MAPTILRITITVMAEDGADSDEIHGELVDSIAAHLEQELADRPDVSSPMVF